MQALRRQKHSNCALCGPNLGALVKQNLQEKYTTSVDFYNAKVVSDIMYNENARIVSVFKDYLLFDDLSDFLKRFYAHSESRQRLPRIYEFYDRYSHVFPNYVVLPENKYMFKNIERKQRILDEQQRRMAAPTQPPERSPPRKSEQIFTSQVAASIARHRPSVIQPKDYAGLALEDLLASFFRKDNEKSG